MGFLRINDALRHEFGSEHFFLNLFNVPLFVEVMHFLTELTDGIVAVAGFVSLVKSLPEVTECYNVSGAFDYLLKIYAPSMADYRDFVLNKLGAFDFIGAIESTFVMSEIKREYAIPL